MTTEVMQLNNGLGNTVYFLVFRGDNLLSKQKISGNTIKIEEYPNLEKKEQLLFIENYRKRLKGVYCSFIERYNTKAPRGERYKCILTREPEEWL